MTCSAASAPGRLDLLGGVADYSGALVLEQPTHLKTTVICQPDSAFTVGSVSVSTEELSRLARLPYGEMREAVAPYPKWTRYIVGVALILVRHGLIEPPEVRLEVSSDLPQSVGVSSSAALEVAAARALGAGRVDPLRLAAICQEAENQVVGAPCGIMDQVAVAVGAPGLVLPILCRPASPGSALPLPPPCEVVGWPTGAEHDVSGVPYRRARAAAFMGKRIAEAAAGRSWAWVSELPTTLVEDLPEAVDGGAFLDRWGATDDSVTTVNEAETYPVRAATSFGVEEHRRAEQGLTHLARGHASALGPLLARSHAGYDEMGLGHPAATAIVDTALARAGVHGARSSGGGAGGTVVVVCDRGVLDDVDGLIR